MLENLAYLHHSQVYEPQGHGVEIGLQPSANLIALPLAFCACLVNAQFAEAARVLKYGSTGQGVVDLQNQLKKSGCFPEGTRSTGYYGKVTRAAVTKLQQQNGLRPDGVAGSQTYAALANNKTCTTSSPNGVLKLGSQGESVRLLQVQLNNWGFPLDGQRLQPTGVFDEETQRALQEFEQYFELSRDSIFERSDSSIFWESRVIALVKHLKTENFYWISSGLKNLDSAERSQAVSTIISLMESGRSIYVTSRGDDATASAAALGILKADAVAAVPNLISLMFDVTKDISTRASAAEALGYIGAKADDVVPALLTVAKTKGEDPAKLYRLRYEAIEALINIGVEDEQVTQNLLIIAKDKQDSPDIRYTAVDAIGKRGTNAGIAVQPLLELLNDKSEDDSELRRNVIDSLGEIGPPAQVAISSLIALLDDRNYSALNLTDGFQGRNLNDELNNIKDWNIPFRESVSSALAKIGTAAIPELIIALQHSDEKVRYSAAFALRKVNPTVTTTSAIEPLKNVMRNPNENFNIRWMAASTLEIMKQDTQGFFSQNQVQSLTTRIQEGCNIGTVFNEYAGRCIRAGQGDGGGPVATCLVLGRCPPPPPDTSRRNP